MEHKQKLLSKLPKVDQTLQDQRLFAFFEDTSRDLIVESVREVIAEERAKILNGSGSAPAFDEEAFFQAITERISQKKRPSLINVVNATGVVLHTNLGRAGLSPSACANVMKIAKGYSTLEYNVKKGARGSRHSHVESLICKITGAEAAMVVNNNAAATMLCLSAMAEDKEVIVSRGELVEIGGSFRIPDIMARSGAKLVEVGTTNKTKIADYKHAITEETAAIMKVHTSNYRIVGFTAEADLAELTALGKESGLPVIYDMGSGLLVDLSSYGIKEPTVGESLKTGIDVILFSGDKLMGGPQAGIIAGKKSLINQMKNHPLARVVRIDKMTLAALESTCRTYLDQEKALKEIPALRMLSEDIQSMRSRGEQLKALLDDSMFFKCRVVEAAEQVGGGSAPTTELKGIAVKLETEIPAEKIERLLRKNNIPIIARIIRDAVYFDMRTVADEELPIIAEAMAAIETAIRRSRS
ncbi:L-seryl-tRNA(Sec) selenium transferase [Ihubacter massiliensis]|uniref:L-seryl-tRNA(Sec) selenium transferase n=1 Tax=Hominibacterium faecale TaxID=2839743 RepID=A0A9J6QU02_9FIRM|nr:MULTISPECIES: L-seryl-tRNA(Sec) selenium transferase [Eubacteriales Family XIII. Incertae Sedis]MCC2864409.1 L-seryl-tRNA(Sec) selenium transferase [Anaerovorax odorimutans]MCI7304371.1 L-seryl-tRNA(Sec) selenium transferase [Clostridia bacterium]MDE8733678.1 L-seryl-tRNA(Sec) selenium transferase [Eubacteriales bacterium DFI.9.88]MDY3011360.1 L-seryl-tRNA(Sec) selenium transferase [Clostridiales Family XIII bacterium]MCO7124068.1 L-seryl-tRNA(Sec) selenium transferase [Ihubacter massiliens